MRTRCLAKVQHAPVEGEALTGCKGTWNPKANPKLPHVTALSVEAASHSVSWCARRLIPGLCHDSNSERAVVKPRKVFQGIVGHFAVACKRL